MRRVLVLLCLTLTAVTPSAGAASGDEWSGYWYSEGAFHETSLDIVAEEGRRFSGILQGPTSTGLTCTLDGTVAESGRTSATGDCSDMSHIVTAGQADAPCCWRNGRVDAADYVVWRKNLNNTSMGADGKGAIVLLKNLPGPNEAAVGSWEGRGVEEATGRAVAITADLRADGPGEVGGGMLVIDDGDESGTPTRPPAGGGATTLAWDVLGQQVQSSLDPSTFVLVGAWSGGVASMLGAFTAADGAGPATIESSGDLVLTSMDRTGAGVSYSRYSDVVLTCGGCGPRGS